MMYPYPSHSFSVLVLPALLVLLPASTHAIDTSISNVGGGIFQASYEVNLNGLTKGNDVTDLFAAAQNSTGSISIEGPSSWSGTGSTAMTHTFDVEPSKMVLMGVTEAIPNGPLGTDKDHIVLGSSFQFAASAAGNKFSVSFPANEQGERMRHSEFVALLQGFATDTTNTTLRSELTTFLDEELLPKAGFNDGFRLIRFTSGETIGTVFRDDNGNGQADEGEGLEGAFVDIVSTNCTEEDGNSTTDSDGNFFVSVLGSNCEVTIQVDPKDKNCKVTVGENPSVVFVGFGAVGVDFGFECEEECRKGLFSHFCK